MDWMILPLKRYADFQGRSRRMEYWMFTLFIFLVVLVWSILFFAVAGTSEPGAMNGAAIALIAIIGLLALAVIVPGWAVQVRRFHDLDMSGWFVLLNFIPYIGSLVVLVFMVLPGKRGANRFGPDPKDPTGDDRVAEIFS